MVVTSGVTSRLTFSTTYEGAPAWSPDGSEILFSLAHRSSGQMTLATVRPDGSELEELGVEDAVVGAYPRE